MKISTELKREIIGNIQAFIQAHPKEIEISIEQCKENLQSFRYWQNLVAYASKCTPLFLRIYEEGCDDKHIDRLLNDILKEYGKHWENGFNKELWIAKQVALDNHKRGIK